MTLHEKHCKILDKVNHSKTQEDHLMNEAYLRAWRDGVKATGRELSLMDGDWYYMDQGYEGDMCCGVWLDWKPSILPDNRENMH